MKKNNTSNTEMTIGLDLGDKIHHGCVLDAAGEVRERLKVANTREALSTCFGKMEPSLVIIEVGTHSPWVSRLLKDLGHEVVVANAWRVKAIHKALNKNDKRDAEFLARLGRADIKLLAPIKHRGEQAQVDRAMLSSRETMVKARTQSINHVRGVVKSFGERLPSCSAESFAKKAREHVPENLQPALFPLLELVQKLTDEIRNYDRRLETLAREEYPETELLRQIPGVGLLTSLAYVLTIEDPSRFAKSREVGPYLGLTPKQGSSGDKEPQLRITKAGDEYLRRMLVNAAHYILGHFGPDCELRRHGEKIAERGGKNAKKRAAVAVARKLSVLLHRLWVDGAEYDPFYQQNLRGERGQDKTQVA